MIRFRAFRNSDPPRLAEIWRNQVQQRGLAQPMSGAILEQYVYTKPYFDREGLILACDEQRPIGFVHAGFGPADDLEHLSSDLGVTCLLLVEPHPDHDAIAGELLAHGEGYLREHHAKVFYGGGIRPLDPFYLGLYGGSELPGVLQSDQAAQNLYRAHDYQEIDRVVVMHRELASFRAAVDRQQLQIRRRTAVQATPEPQPASWWEACTVGSFERQRFELIARDCGSVARESGSGAHDAAGGPLATVTYWNMELLSTTWGVRAAGLVDLRVEQSHQRQGLATFLLGESFRQLQAEGLGLIELQVMQSNRGAIALYEKLGFREIDQGVVFRKNAG